MRPFDTRVLRLVPSARPALLALVLTGVLQGAAAIAQALTISALVVAVVEGRPAGDALRASVLALVVRAVAAGLSESAATRAGVRVSTQLRALLCQDHVSRDIDSRSDTAGALTLAAQGATSVEPYLTRYLPALVQAVLLPPAAVVAMALLDWPTALIPVLTVPLLPVFAALIGSTTAQATARRWQTLARLSGHFLDVMRGLPTLVNYGRAEHQVQTIRAVSHQHRRATVATLRLAFLSSAALELLATLSVALVAVSVGIRLAGGSLTLGVAMPLILLAPEAYWPIRRVGAEFHAAADGAAALSDALTELAPGATGGASGQRAATTGQRAGASGRRAGTTGPAESGRPEHPERSAPTEPRVVLDQVGYHYPSTPHLVLDQVSADIPVGLTVLTGPSGSGKTTLLEIVAGLRRPTSGRAAAPVAHLVTQTPFLAPLSIRENLLLGCRNAAPDAASPTSGTEPSERVAGVLRRVGLSEVVAGLPEGLETRLGDDGFGLSAGQRARLATARALLADTPVVLFDEPVAHLDAESEATITAVLLELATDRVVLAATHRPGLIARADRVIRLPALEAPTTAEAPGAASSTPAPAASGTSAPAASTPATSAESTSAPADSTPATSAVSTSAVSTSAVSTSAPPLPPAAHQGTSGSAHPPVQLPADKPNPAAAPGLALAALAGTLALSSGVALTATSGWLIVAASQRPQILTLLAAVAGVRAFGVARPVLRYAERVRSHDAALGYLAESRADSYARLIPLTPARLGRRSRADLLAGVVDDLDDIAYAQVRVTVPVVAMTGTAALTALAATALWPSAGLVLAGLLVALAVVGVLLGTGERVVMAEVVTARAEVTAATVTLVSRAGELTSAGGAPRLLQTLDTTQHRLVRAISRQGMVRAVGTAAVPLAVAAALVALTPVVSTALGAGLQPTFGALLLLLPMAVGEAAGAVPDAAEAWAKASQSQNRLRWLLGLSPAVRAAAEAPSRTEPPPTPSRPAQPRPPQPVQPQPPQLRLEQVSASWDGRRTALDPTDLHLPPGHHLAVVGANGSGKSTVLAVLARHLDPAGGRYTLDRVSVDDLSLEHTRGLMAIVDDQPHIFASTVRENLRLAGPACDDPQVREALQVCGLSDWLDGLPSGLDTVLGQGGQGVSGGEQARLSLARAVLSRRPVVLLDEPVAHLDRPTAEAVLTDLRRVAVDRTTVLVTHQAADIGAVDQVLDLDAASTGRHGT